MEKFFKTLLTQFSEFYRSLSPMRQVAVIASAVVVLTVAIVVSFAVSTKNYAPLLRNVPSDQLPILMGKLKEKNIPFSIDKDGSTILVPSEFLPATQMSIMSELGNNRIGSMGLEMFEKNDFGATSYVQRINYQRALQGELMRAINTIDVIKQSKVILALPPKKTFLEEGGNPKASVVVDLHPGKHLTPDQVKGIINLVASAVESLEPESVTVVDSNGKVLNRKSSGEVGVSAEVNEMREKIERQLEDRIESILARVVGEGRVIARVNASLDMRNVVAVEETLDPDRTAVKTVQSEEEKLNGNRSSPAGVPGARANLPGAQDQGEVGFRQDVSKELKTTNYEVPKTVKNIKESPGKIERISIAVLVDGVSQEVTGADGKTEAKWSPRSPEELAKFESLIRNAIGYNEKRGDSIKVENIEFKKEDFTESQELLTKVERRKLLSFILKWFAIAGSLALIFFMVFRPFMRWITESFQESVDNILPRTIEELEQLQGIDNTLPGMSAALPMVEETIDPDKAESELLRDRIMSLVEKDQKKAADALGLWLVRRD